MAGAIFNRVKTWANLEVIRSSDLNAEFDNILNNLLPAQIDDHSLDLTEMRATSDPGEVGTESLATSLAGEIERIRFVLKEITGNSQWYETPPRSLATSNIAVSAYLPFAGGSLDEVYSDSIRRGAIPIAGVFYSDVTDQSGASFSIDGANVDIGSTNVKFDKYSYSMASGNVLAINTPNPRPSKGSASLHFRNSGVDSGLFCNPANGIECVLDGSGYIKLSAQKHTAASVSAKNSETITGSTVRSGNTSGFNHLFFNWSANEAGGSATDQLQVYIDGVSEATAYSGSDLDINMVANSKWFAGCKINNPTWAKVYTAFGLPDADGWTKVGSDTDTSVTNGVLNLVTDTSSAPNSRIYYQINTGLDVINGHTVEIKAKLNANSQGDVSKPIFQLKSESSASNRSYLFGILHDSIYLSGSTESTGIEQLYKRINTKDWHVYRITALGSPTTAIRLYVDGIAMGEVVGKVGTHITSYISFGDHDNSNVNHTCDIDVEYVRYYNNGALAPVTEATQGELDDIAILNDVVEDSVFISSIKSNPISSVLSSDKPINISNDTSQAIFIDFDALTGIGDTDKYTDLQTGNTLFYSDGISRTNIYAQILMTGDGNTGDGYIIYDDFGHYVGSDLTVGNSNFKSAGKWNFGTDFLFKPLSLYESSTFNRGIHKGSINYALNTASGTGYIISRNLSTVQISNISE